GIEIPNEEREIVRLSEIISSSVYEKSRSPLTLALGHDISGEPVLRKHVIWERSIPQYTVGYASALDAMDRLEETWPGWFMAGNYRTGVSVGAAVDSGADAARRCTTFLAS
ncbi:MAG: hypothetical protein WD205_05825, partial [Rhodothermales bacterium]